MKHIVDSGICYKIAFESIASDDDMAELVNKITEYTGLSVIIADKFGRISAWELQEGVDDTWREATRNGQFRIDEWECYGKTQKAENLDVQAIHVQGRIEAYSMLVYDETWGASDVEKVNGILCEAFGMLLLKHPISFEYNLSAKHQEMAEILFCETPLTAQEKEYLHEYEECLIPGYVIWILNTELQQCDYTRNICREVLDFHGDTLFYCENGFLYILFLKISEDNAGRLSGLEKQILEKYTCDIGKSGCFYSVSQISNKKSMVLKCMEVGKKLHEEERVFREKDYFLEAVCHFAVEQMGVDITLDKGLLLLQKEDAEKGTEFYHTLKQYLLNGRNVSDTAKKLFIHRNTMIYRLRKIQEILREEINDPYTARYFLVSMLMYEMS